jgi:YqaJ-like viral recombinase domain
MMAQPEPVCHLVIPKDMQAPGTQAMTVVDVIQGTPEWRQARVGSLGASRVHDAVARTRNGWAASRAGALSDVVCERLTGLPVESFITEAMRRGTALEPQARAAYAFQHDMDVELVGLVRHPRISGTHASPDGLVAGCGWWRSNAQPPTGTWPLCSRARCRSGTSPNACGSWHARAAPGAILCPTTTACPSPCAFT